jgi:hypothetical protein
MLILNKRLINNRPVNLFVKNITAIKAKPGIALLDLNNKWDIPEYANRSKHS